MVLAAVDLFTEQGYDATTVAQIAERAGVTKSTFFRHFPDKRELLVAGQLLRPVLGEVGEEVLSGARPQEEEVRPDPGRARLAGREHDVGTTRMPGGSGRSERNSSNRFNGAPREC